MDFTQYYRAQLTGVTGTQTLDVSGNSKSELWIYLTTSGTVSAGTLTVGVRGRGVPSSAGYQDLASTIDMTSPSPHRVQGVIDKLQFTPSSFDGDSYSIYVVGV